MLVQDKYYIARMMPKKAKIVVKEMLDLLTLDLVEKHLVTDQIVLTVGYDIENLTSGKGYTGEVTVIGMEERFQSMHMEQRIYESIQLLRE